MQGAGFTLIGQEGSQMLHGNSPEKKVCRGEEKAPAKRYPLRFLNTRTPILLIPGEG